VAYWYSSVCTEIDYILAFLKAKILYMVAPLDFTSPFMRTLWFAQEGLEKALTDAPLHTMFEQAVMRLYACVTSEPKGRIIVSGMGKSGYIARKITATFASTGTPAHFVHPSEASHGDLGMIQKEDTVLALSWSGETRELSDLVAYTRRFDVPLIAMTSGEESVLAKAATVALILPRVEEACPHGLAPTTSSTLQLAVGDALAVALLEKRGFSAQDFKLFHPGGKLGAQLKSVHEVMHKGDRLPLVSPTATMTQALVEQTAKGLGCVLVCDGDVLHGIITDGDLRRHMAPDLLQRGVVDIMTKNPATLRSDSLAIDGLAFMEKRGINVLPVVDESNHLVGVIHLLDLLRAGVA
jgi:arabinose-5-phosphate isomerase